MLVRTPCLPPPRIINMFIREVGNNGKKTKLCVILLLKANS